MACHHHHHHHQQQQQQQQQQQHVKVWYALSANSAILKSEPARSIHLVDLLSAQHISVCNLPT
jgi:hypothetical protein